MPRLNRSARTFLLCASMLSAPFGATTSAFAADATPEQAKAIEGDIRSFLANMLGSSFPLGAQPIRIAPAGDHYTAAVALAPGKDVTADVLPAANGAWTFEKLHYPTPAQFTTTMPAGPGTNGRELHLNYNIKVAEQDGRGTIDPTFATPSTATTTLRGLDVSVDGANQMNSVSHIGRGTGESTLRPAGDGLLDVITNSALEDYSSTTTTQVDGKPTTIRIAAGKAVVNAEGDGISRDRAPLVMQAMVQFVAGVMAQGPGKAGKPPEIGTAPVRALLTALEGAATSLKLDESVERLHVVSGPTTVDLDRARFGLQVESPSGVLNARMDLGMEGLKLPGLALGPFEQFIPSRVSFRPSITGVKTADLIRALQASVAEGRAPDAGPPPEFMQMLMSGAVQMGLDSFEVDLGTSVMTGMGKVGFTGPGQLAGQGQITMTNFDALVDRVKGLPQAGQALPALLFVKGIGRTAGEQIVWDITYDGAKVLVNGVDVAAMAGGR